MANNLDERLLAGSTLAPEQESAAAEELRQRRRDAIGEETGDPSVSSGQVDSDEESKSFMEKVQAARQALDLKARAKKKVEEKVVAPIRQGTSRALQWAWKALIPSWGLSAIWINIHVFLKQIFGEKLFCKLGEEWLPKQAVDAAGEAGKAINKSAGLVEIMVLIFLDVIAFIVIGIFVSLFTNESTFKVITGEANKSQPAPVVQQVK